MATLTVLKFDTPEGAAGMLDKIKSLQKQQLIKFQDAAIVTWPEGQERPQNQATSQPGRHGCSGWRFLGHALWLDLLRAFLRHGRRRSYGGSRWQDGRLRHR